MHSLSTTQISQTAYKGSHIAWRSHSVGSEEMHASNVRLWGGPRKGYVEDVDVNWRLNR